MSSLIHVLLGVILVPLFVGSWRMSLAGLSAQGLLMAGIAHAMGHDPAGGSDWMGLLDLVVVRGLCAPVALGAVLRLQKTPGRNDLVPPNILWWTVALGAPVAAFNFAEAMVPAPGDPQALVAVATSGVLIGFLMLATQANVLTQMFGLLHIENAIALFELGGGPHHAPMCVRIGQTVALLVTIALCRFYLAAAGSDPKREFPEAQEASSL